MYSNGTSEIRPDVTAFDTACGLWAGTHHRDLVDHLRKTAQRRTRMRAWMRRSITWM